MVRKELIRPTPAPLPSHEASRFRHLLVRDAAYDSLPKAVRAGCTTVRRLDGPLSRSGSSSRTRSWGSTWNGPPATAATSAILTRTVEERAASRLASAGVKALARDDMPAAHQPPVAGAGPAPAGPGRADALLLQVLEALKGAGDVDLEQRVIDELEASSDDNTRMRGRLARLDLAIAGAQDRITEEARATAREAVDLFEKTGDDAGLAHAWNLLFEVEWLRSRAEASLAAIEKALEHARRAGDTTLMANLYMFRMGPLMWGPFPAAIVRSKLTEMQGLAWSSPRIEQAMLTLEASLAAQAGHFAVASEYHQRSDAMLSELGLTMIRHLTDAAASGARAPQGRSRRSRSTLPPGL